MHATRITLVAAALSGVVLTGTLAAQDLPGGLIPNANNPPTRQGTRGANFLELGVGARAQAMAGALTALVEGPTSWYWNPAGAANTEQFAVGATRADLYAGLNITHSFIGVAIPLGAGVLGASFINLSSGNMERTTEDNPAGGDPTLGSTFDWSSSSIGISYARRLTDRLELGATVKHVSEGVSGASVSWGALDVGTQFRTGLYGLSIGASIQNLGPSARARGALIERKVNSDQFSKEQTAVEFGTLSTDLPTLFRFSLGSDVFGGANALFGPAAGKNSVVGELSFNKATDTGNQMALGLEYSYANILFLRGGKRFYNDGRATGSSGTYGLSGGGGLRLPVAGRAIRLDYAYTSVGDLQNVQVFSFEFGH
ncbi:MAG: PorV/PorQ family protein [Gemmatimonadota bacterium]|nr:PorV/PorQ family protein [Gemmatimonadota bacterium]